MVLLFFLPKLSGCPTWSEATTGSHAFSCDHLNLRLHLVPTPSNLYLFIAALIPFFFIQIYIFSPRCLSIGINPRLQNVYSKALAYNKSLAGTTTQQLRQCERKHSQLIISVSTKRLTNNFKSIKPTLYTYMAMTFLGPSQQFANDKLKSLWNIICRRKYTRACARASVVYHYCLVIGLIMKLCFS